MKSVSRFLLIVALIFCASAHAASLTIDLSYVNQSSSQFARFKAFVDAAVAGNPGYNFSATDAAYMFRITGQQQYAQLCVANADAQVTAAEAAIAAGHNPDVAGDSYLGAGPMIQDVAIAYAWCGASASQKTRFAAYASQTVSNIWHYQTASWGGRSAPWSGWAVTDMFNNYQYSFQTATLFWALASNDATLIAFETQQLQTLSAAYQTIAGGGSLEGSGYGMSHMVLFALYQVAKDSGLGDFGNANAHMCSSIAWWLYDTAPTWDHFGPLGDQSRSSEPTIYDYNVRLVLEAGHLCTDPAAVGLANWWLSNVTNGGAGHGQMQQGFNMRFGLIPFTTTTNAPASLNFRAPETGLISGRTSWSTDAVLALVEMGLYDQSHAGQEQGGYTFFKGTWLAVTNNIWSHSGINQGTTDKNIARIERSGSVQPQRECDTCKVNVTSYGTSSGGGFHVVGDLTPVYASGSGVTSYKRTADFAGGVLTIADALTLTSGTAATEQVNVPVQPSIAGNVITAGDLRITVIVPASPTISVTNFAGMSGAGGSNDYARGYRVNIGGSSTAYTYTVESISFGGVQVCTNPQPTSTPLCSDGVTHQTGGTWSQAPFPGCAWTYVGGTCPPPPDTYTVSVAQPQAHGARVLHSFTGVTLGDPVQFALMPTPVLHWHAQHGSDSFEFPTNAQLSITSIRTGTKPGPSTSAAEW